eukprot:COSAG06_NODE_65459_length_257_cov_0.556962_1_plen_25_part_10
MSIAAHPVPSACKPAIHEGAELLRL